MVRGVKDWAVYLFVLAFIKLFSLLPPVLLYGGGKAVGRLLYSLLPRYRERAFENLRDSFKEKSEEEVDRITRAVFENMGLTAAEVVGVLGEREKWLEEAVHFEGAENVERALARRKGIILMTAHYGNWEAAALGFGKRYPFNFVVRPIDNPYLDRMLRELRGMFGSGIIPKKNAMRAILSALKRNETVGILMDQNVLRKDGLFVDFFGRKANTTPVVATIARRTGAAVLPAFATRTEPGKFKIVVDKEVLVEESDDAQGDIERYTALFTSIIEEKIRQNPDQWFWVHRRWKTRPADEL